MIHPFDPVAQSLIVAISLVRNIIRVIDAISEWSDSLLRVRRMGLVRSDVFGGRACVVAGRERTGGSPEG